MRTYVLFVLVLFPSALLGQSINDRYEKFINQHINPGMNWSRCDTEMHDRNISITDKNQCKETNTFIKAGIEEIKNVCNAAGKLHRKIMVSNQRFPIVTCKLKRNHVFPNCKYDGQSAEKRIVIECEDGLPVHFKRDLD
ncbi:hypothetical protein NQD34_007943 [Periophthalmus magnuspinnatus]|nr:hypothetical protein NQD34_007943 [Periophthalmus magnuspinnatus]